MSIRSTGFYQSNTWTKVRNYYYIVAGGHCERCGAEDTKDIILVVHHRDHLTMIDYITWNIKKLFGHDNLELLCQSCHNKEHKQTIHPLPDDYLFDKNGDIIEKK